jgi:Type ISP C-terminal specificity domain
MTCTSLPAGTARSLARVQEADELLVLGGELVSLHLVEAPVQQAFPARYHRTGRAWRYEVAENVGLPVTLSFNGPEKPVVGKVGWSDDTVWIDAVKPKKSAADSKVTGAVGFRGVSEGVWDLHIGGYQIGEKWLKDRKGRALRWQRRRISIDVVGPSMLIVHRRCTMDWPWRNFLLNG